VLGFTPTLGQSRVATKTTAIVAFFFFSTITTIKEKAMVAIVAFLFFATPTP